MPTSHYTQIPAIIEAIIETKPESVLEVGIGCGKWGILTREYLDVWNRYLEPWGSHHTKIVGIEAHMQYSDSPGWSAYDTVLVSDVRELDLDALGDFDMALMVDVLEHFDHDEGVALIDRLLIHCEHILVAIPTNFFPTVEVWDNPHEIHKCAWTIEEFAQHGEVKVYRNADSLVVRVSRFSC